MRFRRALGANSRTRNSGAWWITHSFAPIVLMLVAFAVVAFVPQPGEAQSSRAHSSHRWVRSLFRPQLAHVAAPRLGRGNRIVAKGSRKPASAPKGKPDRQLYTATSRTYVQANGLRTTRIFAAPVNYRASGGAWHPIANRLVSAGHDAVRNKANRYRLTIPRRAERAVRIALGKAWVSFRLVGARGRAVVRRNVARFPNALPGVSLSYAADGGAVKESLVLSGSAAPASYAFVVRTSRGVRVARRGAELVAVGRHGRTLLRFVAPFAYAQGRHGLMAARHRVSMRVARGQRGERQLKLSLAPGWLAKHLARGKVVIDPTASPGPVQDCNVEGDTPDTNYCASDIEEVGWAGDHDHHSLLKFDIQGSVPYDSEVLSAKLGMYLSNESTTDQKSVSAVQVTKPWTTGVTWNTYDGTHQWSTPGGDTADGYKATNPAVGGSTGWYYWYPTDLAQQWEDGTLANNGLLLEDTTAQQTVNDFEFDSSRTSDSNLAPYMDILTEPRGIGNSSRFTFRHTALNSTMNMDVNAASGDLRISNTDMDLPATGRDFVLVRAWDSLLQEQMTYWRWDDSYGTALLPLPDPNKLAFFAPDGAFYMFTLNPDGSWSSPDGLDATLCTVNGTTCTGSPTDSESTAGSATYSLTYHRTGEKFTFDHDGHMESDTDSAGNAVIAHDNWDGTGYMIDSQGRHINYAYESSHGYITSWSDPRGGSDQYKYDTSGFKRLSKFIDTSAASTTYTYTSGWGDLKKVTDPSGQAWKFTHDGDHRVLTSTQITDTTNNTGPTTTYAYYPGSDTTHGHSCSVTDNTKKTVITDPNGDQATYCANVYDEVFEIWDKNGQQNSPPSIQLSGSLKNHENKTLYSGQYKLHVDSQDGAVGTVPSGVKSIEIFLDGQSKDYAEQDCPNGGCPMSRDWTLDVGDPTLLPGEHTVRVEATDQTGLHASSSLSFRKGTGTAPNSSMSGLEDFYQYQSAETGAGTAAHVNLANGNLVWHSVPIVNPGRGLSSYVSLTYNSETQVPDGALEYNQAGHGFSLGISGITRLNEPLDVTQAALGQITLTDADGTQHVFRSDDGETFTPPPGVNLHLRRYSAGLALLLTDPSKAWAATRPDGVTFYFDEAGYPTSIEDRNGNVITYDYEYFGLTGGICDAVDPAALGVDGNPVCLRRVDKVTDPAGRALTLSYDSDTVTGGVLQSRVKSITDHLGVVTDFTYDDNGFLTQLDEGRRSDQNDGLTDATRTFKFDYEPSDTGVPDWQRYMTAVTDPRGNATTFSYEPRQLPNLDPRRLLTLQDRREDSDHPTRFAYLTSGESGCSSTYCTTVTDALGHDTSYELDSRGRMTKMTDARGADTLLQWDDDTTDDNDVSQITEAAGTSDEAVTQMTYNQNGLLTSSTDPNGHETTLAYRDGAGTQLSPRGTDDGGTFVSDLTSLTTPRGNETSTDGDFTYQFQPDDKGNVHAQIDPLGNEADTGFDDSGEITSEEDWHTPGDAGNLTTYSDFDANGNAQKMVDPRGNNGGEPADEHQWFFNYDADGNLRQVTDPRGATGAPSDPHTTFTTTLTYDSLGQTRAEQRPKDSSNNVFVNRQYSYDLNGNLTDTIDGNSADWHTTFTPMDDPEDVSSPPTAHGDSPPALETTHYAYDQAGNVTDVTQPNGTATSQADDFSTHYVYDQVNEAVAQIERSRGGGVPDKDLATSYAYDLRGNLIGLVDPNRNTQYGGAPEDNAQDPNKRRFTYEYDKANNRTAEIEDPGNLAYRTQLQYDANDNPIARVNPRGTQSGANPDDYTYHYTYDDADRLTATADEDGRLTQWVLRPDGRPASMTKPKGTASSADGDYQTSYDYYPTGELKSFTLPRDPNQYGPTQQVSYERNAVGDPTKITDARGNVITNTFFDTGELESTDRPSFWQYTPNDPNGGPDISEPTPDRIIAGLAPQDSFAGGQRPAGTAAQTDQGQSDGPLGGTKQGNFGQLKRQQPPGVLPDAGYTTFGYDDNMALTGVTDAKNHLTTIGRDATGRITSIKQPLDASTDNYITNTFAFDLDGNLAQQTDGENKVTTYVFDQFDRQVGIHAPAASDDANKTDDTSITYDDNGNTLAVQTPRGPSSTWQYGYDTVDRLKDSIDPTGGDTSYTYDPAGNVSSTTSPNGNDPNLDPFERPGYQTTYAYDHANQLIAQTDGLNHTTNYSYDADGNQTQIDAPGASSTPGGDEARQVTNSTYDGRDLPWTTTIGTGDHAHTTVTEYDGNGNLRRVVNPAGVDSGSGLPKNADNAPQVTDPSSASDRSNSAVKDATQNATVYEYSPDNLLTSTLLPWGTSDDSNSSSSDDGRQFRIDFVRSDALKRVDELDSAYLWTQDQPNKVKSTYSYFDNGWIKTASLPGGDDSGDGSGNSGQSLPTNSQFEYQYDKQGNQKLWCTENTDDSGCQGNDARRVVHETYFPSGDLEQRKAQDDPSADARTYDYSYNDNGSLIKEIDNKLGRTTSFTYDDAERNTRVNDEWQGGSDSLLTYDLDGNVTERQTDGHFDSQNPEQYDGGRKSTLKYDQLDREKQAIVEPSNGDPAHTTDTGYYPSGERDSQTTHNGTSTDSPTRFVQKWFYTDDGLLARMQRFDASGNSTKDQDYSYDVDGNRTKDERGGYGFNARDQLTHWSGTHQDVSYTLNGAGAVTQKQVTPDSTGAPQTTDFSYMPGTDVLTHASSGGQDWFYCYSSSGDLTRIARPACDQSDQGDPSADYYNYDAFDRLLSAKGPDNQPGAGSDPHGYQYDGLDRPYSECVGNSTTTSFQDVQDKACPDGHTRTDSYVGMSPLLSQQQDQAAGTTQSFDYDSSFNQIGQQTDGGSQAGYQSYAQSADGSVEGLLGNAGQSTGSYFYDPYGELQKPDGSQPDTPAPGADPNTAEAALSDSARANPFRYQDFHEDSGVKTYDMQARQYRPDVGRFLTQDTYESSLGQANLESDPLTQDSYAFAGGNPVNNIEFDGHKPQDCPACDIHGRVRPSDRKVQIGYDKAQAERYRPLTSSEEEKLKKALYTPPPTAVAEPGPAPKKKSGIGGLLSAINNATLQLHVNGLGCLDPNSSCQAASIFHNDPGTAVDRLSSIPWNPEAIAKDALEIGAKQVVKHEAEHAAANGAAEEVGGLEDLAARRAAAGHPAAGPGVSPTLSRLDVEGMDPLYGTSGHGRTVGLRVNPISRTHAETDALQQLADLGGAGGRDATLYVDYPGGLCGACGRSGAVRSMARQVGIRRLTVVSPKGREVIVP